MFQSTPDLVNRENSLVFARFFHADLFQSTPDLVNRENMLALRDNIIYARFQSTPDLVNRENVSHVLTDDDCSIVSIHSRFS